MSLYNLTNATTPDGILVGTATSVPAFPIMILVFTWFFVLLGGSSKQNSRYGYADMPQWAVLASLSTFILALMMSITAGVIATQTLVVVIGVTILSAVWFFMSRGRNE